MASLSELIADAIKIAIDEKNANGPFTPILNSENKGKQNTVIFSDEPQEDAVESAKFVIEQIKTKVDRLVLAYDSKLSSKGNTYDAIIIEAQEGLKNYLFAQLYQYSDSGVVLIDEIIQLPHDTIIRLPKKPH